MAVPLPDWRETEGPVSDASDDQATGGCSAGNQSDPHFQAATGPNRQATAGKRAFLRLWDPLARQYGLTTYQQNQI